MASCQGTATSEWLRGIRPADLVSARVGARLVLCGAVNGMVDGSSGDGHDGSEDCLYQLKIWHPGDGLSEPNTAECATRFSISQVSILRLRQSGVWMGAGRRPRKALG